MFCGGPGGHRRRDSRSHRTLEMNLRQTLPYLIGMPRKGSPYRKQGPRQRTNLGNGAFDKSTGCIAVAEAGPKADHLSMYWASPFPNDQFSQATSTRLITRSCGRKPGFSANISAMRL